MMAAKLVFETLQKQNLKLVLAESCTSGLAAAALGGVPGVSGYFCGSAVTYRIDTKSKWLGIEADLIEAHTAESPETSLAMALGILDRTPEADLSAAITGHLGPGAPPEKDGVVYVAVARRDKGKRTTTWESFTLEADHRIARQQEASERMLGYVVSSLKE
jgi:PncC family amidohydrolase